MSPTTTGLAAAALVVVPFTIALASQTIHVTQKDRDFDTHSLTIAVGDTVEFINEDPFLHQIYTERPGFSFDSDEQSPGELISVRFSAAGTYDVRCGIHPRMLLTVHVE